MEANEKSKMENQKNTEGEAPKKKNITQVFHPQNSRSGISRPAGQKSQKPARPAGGQSQDKEHGRQTVRQHRAARDVRRTVRTPETTGSQKTSERRETSRRARMAREEARVRTAREEAVTRARAARDVRRARMVREEEITRVRAAKDVSQGQNGERRSGSFQGQGGREKTARARTVREDLTRARAADVRTEWREKRRLPGSGRTRDVRRTETEEAAREAALPFRRLPSRANR